MKMNNLVKYLKFIGDFSRENEPALLSGAAIGGVIATAFSAYKAGIKAKDILKDYYLDIRLVSENDKETKKVVKKECAVKMTKAILPTAVLGSATIACVIGSNIASSRRIAVLSAAYALSENRAENLNKKMEEIIGKEKAENIRKEAIKEEATEAMEKQKNKQNSKNSETLMVPGEGNVWCYDAGCGRWFKVHNKNDLESKILSLSQRCMSEMFISKNELYQELGMDIVNDGGVFGWNVEDMTLGRLPIQIDDTIMNDITGEPAILMDYNVHMRRDYREMY